MIAFGQSLWRAPSFGRRLLASFLLGLLSGLAFPPFNAIPVLWLSFPALVFLLRGIERKKPVIPAQAGIQSRKEQTAGFVALDPGSALADGSLVRDDGRGQGKQAFLIGWGFALGLLIVSLHWIAGALFVDIGIFWWVLPFAVAGLPACFALYYGFAALAAHRYGLSRVSGVFFFALCWFLADIARAHLLTGFPWDITGYVWGDCLPVLQITSVIGIEGLTLLTLLLAVLPALFFVCEKKKAALGVLAGLVLLGGVASWGQARLNGAPEAYLPNVRLRIVQPSIDQKGKWDYYQRRANLEKLMDLSFSASGEEKPTHIIWPETATAFYLTEEPDVRREIASRMSSGSVLLTGVVRRQADAAGALRYYNSLIVMDSGANVIGGYDKHHLVPFGEYMPLRSLVPFRVITALGKDFSSGEGVRSLRAPALPAFSPLVCYEAIFSGEVASRSDPPHFLLNVTNDAWYEGTIGPAQHFAIVRVRAIEEGLPLVRASNKGLSGIVDPYGRFESLAGEEKEDFVEARLPEPVGKGTIFSKQENKLSWLMVFALLSFLFFRRLRV